jgi:hypothetical protein
MDDATQAGMVNASLPKSSFSKGKTIMERANWATTPTGTWTGANLADYVIATVTRGCIFKNKTTVLVAFTRMWQEVKVSHQPDDNIQQDGSFHQHSGFGKSSLLAGSYGGVFSADVLHLSAMSTNTSFTMPSDQLAIFTHLLLDGQQWMTTFKGTWDFSVIGRSNSAPSSHHIGFNADEVRALPVAPHRRAELENFAQLVAQTGGSGKNGTCDPLVGNRGYWDSDYVVHRREGFMVTVRMYSRRTIAARCVNLQGKKNFRSADGVTNLFSSHWTGITGDEYYDIEPTWSFHDLNGMTNEVEIPLATCKTGEAYNKWPLLMNYTSFVGSVSDGEYGAAAMDLSSGTLRMHNAWFFLDDGYIHMGADIRCSSGSPLVTTIANRLLGEGGRVTVAGNGSSRVLPAGQHSFPVASAPLAWVHLSDPSGSHPGDASTPHDANTDTDTPHDPLGIAYVPLLKFSSSVLPPTAAASSSGGVMRVTNTNRSGDWAALGTSHGNVTRETFELSWTHGRCAAGGGGSRGGGSRGGDSVGGDSVGGDSAFAYRTLVGVRPSQIPAEQSLVVVNNRSAQAIFDKPAGMLQAVLWEAGGLHVQEGWDLAANASCLVMMREQLKAATKGAAGAPAEYEFQVTASNPEGVLYLAVSVDRQLVGANCTYDPASNRTSFGFELGTGDWAGQSRTISCTGTYHMDTPGNKQGGGLPGVEARGGGPFPSAPSF